MKEDCTILIEEWFGDCNSAEEVAELYAELLFEIRCQMQFCFKTFTQEVRDD